MKNKFRNLNDKAKYHLDQLLMEMHITSYAEGYEAGKVVAETWSNANPVLVKSVEEIEHDGKVLRKVDRESKTGDYVRFQTVINEDTKTDKFYEVFNGHSYRDDADCELNVYGWHNSCPDPEVFEVVEAIPQIVKSPNQQRAELIQKAKDFVEGQKNIFGFYSVGPLAHDAKFIQKGNKVTCLLTGFRSNKVLHIGRSNCNPNDVFNLYIGQAISLARALKIDVPVEFLEAVQPSEKVVGMMVKHKKLNKMMKLVKREKFNSSEEVAVINSIYDRRSIISDDSEAQYEVQS